MKRKNIFFLEIRFKIARRCRYLMYNMIYRRCMPEKVTIPKWFFFGHCVSSVIFDETGENAASSRKMSRERVIERRAASGDINTGHSNFLKEKHTVTHRGENIASCRARLIAIN